MKVACSNSLMAPGVPHWRRLFHIQMLQTQPAGGYGPMIDVAVTRVRHGRTSRRPDCPSELCGWANHLDSSAGRQASSSAKAQIHPHCHCLI